MARCRLRGGLSARRHQGHQAPERDAPGRQPRSVRRPQRRGAARARPHAGQPDHGGAAAQDRHCGLHRRHGVPERQPRTKPPAWARRRLVRAGDAAGLPVDSPPSRQRGCQDLLLARTARSSIPTGRRRRTTSSAHCGAWAELGARHPAVLDPRLPHTVFPTTPARRAAPRRGWSRSATRAARRCSSASRCASGPSAW